MLLPGVISMRRLPSLLLVVVAALSCFAPLALADWPPGGVLVRDGAYSPRVVADGAGGALVSFSNVLGPTGIYVLRIGADGAPAPGWPAEGVPLTTAQVTAQGMVPDGSGGAYVMWTVGFPADSARLMVGRIGANGAIPAGWTAGGRAVTSGPGQATPKLLADGSGAAVMVWRDRRASVGFGSSICAQKVLATGANASGFSALGRVIVAREAGSTDTFQFPDLVADPAGGWWLTYATLPADPGPMPIQLARLGANLARTPDWQLPDLVVGDAAPYGVTSPAPVAPDGAGGAYVAVQQGDLRLTHTTAMPELDPAWPAGGAVVDPISTPASPFFVGTEQFPLLVADGAGGAVVIWQSGDAVQPYPVLVGQRWLADGTVAPGWATPLEVSGTHRANALVGGGALFASGFRIWMCAHFNCDGDGLANCLRLDGSQPAGWATPAPPEPFTDGPGLDLWPGIMNNDGAQLAPDGNGGIFAAFTLGTFVSGASGIRLARFAVEGPVASVAPPAPGALALRALRAGPADVRATLVTRVAGPIDMSVFDVAGRRLGRAVFEVPAGFAGEVSVRCDDGASGLVFVRARQGADTAVSRALRLR